MKPARFSIIETLKFSLYTTLKKMPFFTGLLLIEITLISIYALGAMLLVFIQLPKNIPNKAAFFYVLSDTSSLPGVTVIALIIGILLLLTLLSLSLIRIAFDIHDIGQSSMKRLFSGWAFLFRGTVLYFLYMTMRCFGSLFFVIPGLMIEAAYMLAPYILIDKKSGIIAAFKESARLTRGSRMRIFVVTYIPNFIICLLALAPEIHPFLMLVPALAMGLIFLPMQTLAGVYLYRQLQSTDPALQTTGLNS